MNGKGLIRSARFLRRWQAAGLGDAKRRFREEQEDGRIREARARGSVLLPEERAAQEEASRTGGPCFRILFLNKAVNEKSRATAMQSLREQTWPINEDNADYTVFLEPDGWLHPGALYECAQKIRETGAELIYSDEDFYTEKPGDRNMPYFKPDYGPDSLRGCNYTGPFLVCRNKLLKEAGAEHYAELDDDERWDTVIRLAERAKGVSHIAKVLYYRQIPEGEEVPEPAVRRVNDPIKGEPLVSILIPNKDHRDDLERCVDSIREKTSYRNYEILIIENNSTEAETFQYYEELKKDSRIRVISREGPFNYSAVNNLGAREARGEQLLLLNNDTEVISPDWIQEMLMYTQRPDVGAAGAKLCYPDGTIQHAGIGIGITVAAGHYHRGFPGDSGGYFSRLQYAQNVSAVTAACMMIPRKVYEEMQGLDESYPIMFNDVDLCLRIRQAGYLIVWTPRAELTHYESKSRGSDRDTPEKKKFFIRETNRFLRKWCKVLEAGDPYYNVNLTRTKEDFSLR